MEVSFELEKTKEKKRLLQMRIDEMKAEISKKKNLILKLEDDLERMRRETQEDPNNEAGEGGENKLSLFMRDICIVLQTAVNEDAFMKAKYATQSSQMYYKIEKDIFEGYISRLSALEVKEFIEFCKQLSVIKLENNKCVFPSGRIRVYFLSKGIVDGLKM